MSEYWQQHKLDGEPPRESSFSARTLDQGATIKGTFVNNKGQGGSYEVRNEIEQPAPKPDVELKTWAEFRSYIGNFRGRPSLCFRGQTNSAHKLRTLFHRSGRSDMIRYFMEDFGTLCRRVNAISTHIYDAGSLEEGLALLGLAQHHGYPTPLLDWSLSPYIAAFFAFDLYNGFLNDGLLGQNVRIFVFEFELWNTYYPRLEFRDPWPQLTFVELPAHNNPRYLPQQAIASFTNMDDIERFIRAKEAEKGVRFLTTIDVPFNEREEAYSDLEMMGITPATLFPGFDGICRALRMRFFR